MKGIKGRKPVKRMQGQLPLIFLSDGSWKRMLILE